MKPIISSIEINADSLFLFIGFVVLVLLVLLHINFILFMKALKKKSAKRVKVSTKPSKYYGGLMIVAGSGATAERLIKRLCAEGRYVIHVTDRRNSFVAKQVTVIEGAFDGNILESVGFIDGAHDITVFCVYENDNENLNTALILNSALEKRMSGCGRRAVRISYKNIAKTQFYNNLHDCITYFNTDEMTARSFVERFDLQDYLPISGSKPNRDSTNTEEYSDKPATMALTVLSQSSVDELKNEKEVDKPFSVRRIFVGFSALNAEILEKLVFAEKLCEENLNAVVFDKDADKILPAFYNHTNDVLDVEHIGIRNATHSSKMIALKIDAEAFELYEKINAFCELEDFCAIYIDIGNSVVNTETALELRDTLIKNGNSQKAVIFAYNDSQNFIQSCFALNKGFREYERIVFFGASDIID